MQQKQIKIKKWFFFFLHIFTFYTEMCPLRSQQSLNAGDQAKLFSLHMITNLCGGLNTSRQNDMLKYFQTMYL